MNEENNNFDVSFENEENSINSNIPDETVIPGNIIGIDEEDSVIGNNDINESNEEFSGPIIVNSNNDIIEDSESVSGPIIVNSDSNEVGNVEKYKDENPNISFKELENEIKNLKEEKEDVEKNIEHLTKRKDELEILIKSKQEELDYKKEVEVTTDKLKTYIRDLEVKPGAVRDALAALINNMDK